MLYIQDRNHKAQLWILYASLSLSTYEIFYVKLLWEAFLNENGFTSGIWEFLFVFSGWTEVAILTGLSLMSIISGDHPAEFIGLNW